MVYLLVFLSGAAALIYEVIWGRQLATFLGITTYAHTVVLASFMAGLAIGAWLFGRLVDRTEKPLRLFATLEAGIGIYGLSTLLLVPALQRLYATIAPATLSGWAAQAARLLTAGIAVLPAAILMGGTLPVLVRGLQLRERSLARTVAALYGVNTLGAAAGALASAYLLLPILGVRESLLVGVGINLTVAAGVFLLRYRRTKGTDPPARVAAAEQPLSTSGRALLLTAFGLSGAAALALQIAWIRALTQIIGSSVYAFGLTTASYLLGLALGSLVAALLAERLVRRRATLAAAAVLEVAIGLTVVAGIPLLGRLPELFLVGYRVGVHESFPLLQLFVFLLTSSVMIIPTLFLGAILPLLTSRAPQCADEIGRGVGAALAANSFGTVIGTLVSGLALLSLFGAEGLLRAAAVLSVAVGGLLWIASAPAALGLRKGLGILAGVATFAILSTAIPRWDPALMTSGPFINAARFVDVPAGKQLRTWIRRRSRILYHQEGVEATVSVRDVSDERLLVINGKTDGSRFGDRRTQMALGHLPLLSHPAPRRVLLVGLGTGMSAAAAAAHTDISNLTVIELSPEVVEASRFFLRENEAVLQDPRLRLESADARNFLLTVKQPFDVILSQPSNAWISGVSNLFTREYFSLAAERLAPGGIMAQWFQTYGISQEDLRSVLRSFADSFAQVTVWSPQLGDLLFLGSQEPHRLSLPKYRRMLTEARGSAQLQSVGLLDEAALARLFLLADADVRSFVAGTPANTDNRPRVEFNAPRTLYSETTVDNLIAIIEHLDGRASSVPFDGLSSSHRTDSTFTALGLSIAVTPDFEARAEWRVSWTAFAGAEGLAAPVGVGNRPLILLTGPDCRIEIERGWEEAEPTSEILLDSVRARIEGQPAAIGSLTMSSGEAAVWLTGPVANAPRAAMAWGCGLDGDRFTRYLATVSAAEAPPEEILGRLSRTVQCAPAEPSQLVLDRATVDSGHDES